MAHFYLFTDGSVNPQSSVGYGAALWVSDLNLPIESLSEMVRVKRFTSTSSTKLELQILLWSLAGNERVIGTQSKKVSVTVCTDSQNIVRLPARRARLEQHNYFSKNHKRLANYELYQEFYRWTSQVNLTFIKIKGHQREREKGNLDKLFTLVDQAARQALRTGL